MSVVFSHLTKHFGSQKAVDDVSFTASKGQITCFLGPNGAGKSTTMKMAVGYLMPDNGRVLISGVDVADQPQLIKQKVGYLPEHNPMYLEMYVKEFLGFVAQAYGINGKHRKGLVSQMIELCGLSSESHKKIAQLSKGYRQRVGLAKALLPDPEVLILDEPTSGLDPNQLIEIREIIRNVSREKTVILSTHIMQEVEALADRVVIIKKGKIVADSSIKELKQTTHRLAAGMEMVFDRAVDPAIFEQLGSESQVLQVNELTYRVISSKSDLRKVLMRFATDQDLPLVSINPIGQSLEHVFHQLTEESFKV